MKKQFNGIIVVEGKTDVAFLSSYIDAEFVITNGSDVPEKTVQYLRKSVQNKNIIVLTDPDFPGMKIRNELNEKVPGVKHCFIKKENSIKHGKVGVAEGNIDEILNALDNSFEIMKKPAGSLTSCDLIKLGLAGSEESKSKREIISDKLHLGFCNSKTFLKRLNSLNITYEELEELL